ncbi:EspA/EspE family type VII secretion system effector [Mycolicibacterium thermoresistibile]|nr:EspA/EspE family type VII secretion system effector [Mycolicibacterium thermoresistibile]MCV7189462.1 hypothetical protein [Mycolicibacterium thermoresistibile]
MSAKDHTGWGIAGTGADFVTLMQGMTEAGSGLDQGRLAKAAATPIIRAALLAMMVMSNTCGVGTPEKGDRFEEGAQAFEAAGEALGATKSPESWQGKASNTYTDRNDEQRARAERMAAIDRTVKEILDAEAHQVDVARKMLDRCQTVLSLSIPAAIAAKAIPFKGPAISTAIEVAAVAGTAPLASLRYNELTRAVIRNAARMTQAAGEYSSVASAANPS